MSVVLEVGAPAPNLTPICTSKEECESMDPKFEMGVIYGIKAKVEPRINLPWTQLTGPDRLWAMISYVRQNYPGIIITYVKVTDYGWVELQMVDSPVAVSTIVFAAIVLGILIASAIVINQLVILVSRTLPPPTGPSSPTWWILWGIAGLLIAGAAVKLAGVPGKIAKAIKGKRK